MAGKSKNPYSNTPPKECVWRRQPIILSRGQPFTPLANLLYRILLDKCHQYGFCSESQYTLSSPLGVNDRRLRDYLKELIDKNLIIVFKGSKANYNVYIINNTDYLETLLKENPELHKKAIDHLERRKRSLTGHTLPVKNGLDRSYTAGQEPLTGNLTGHTLPVKNDHSLLYNVNYVNTHTHTDNVSVSQDEIKTDPQPLVRVKTDLFKNDTKSNTADNQINYADSKDYEFKKCTNTAGNEKIENYLQRLINAYGKSEKPGSRKHAKDELIKILAHAENPDDLITTIESAIINHVQQLKRRHSDPSYRCPYIAHLKRLLAEELWRDFVVAKKLINPQPAEDRAKKEIDDQINAAQAREQTVDRFKKAYHDDYEQKLNEFDNGYAHDKIRLTKEINKIIENGLIG